MKGLYRCKRYFYLLPFLFISTLTLMMGTGPGCFETSLMVRRMLLDQNLNNTCKLLKCRSEEDCKNIKEENQLRFQKLQSDILSNRCYSILSRVKHGTPEELEVPLSFSILAHRDFQQLFNLLEAVYRPHNLYCIQLDSKSDAAFVKQVSLLVQCLSEVHNNIFISKKSISLIWQHSSLLEGDLLALQQLLEFPHNWQYYVNIVGSEFVLISNSELVRKLKTVRNNIGFVDIQFPHSQVQDRWKYSYELTKGAESGKADTTLFGSYYKNVPRVTSSLKSLPPKNLTIMYGIKNVAISRKFADYVINDELSKELRVWLKDVLVAVEHFYPTLATVFIKNINYNSNINNNNSTENLKQIPFQDFSFNKDLVEFQMRKTFWLNSDHYCYGQIRREICVLSLLDLPAILQEKGFVMNKFDSDLDPSVVTCLNEMIYGLDKEA
ncbi:beta-1,3-galactosyl-O-glycosyl-glycoprotein beta-1,6-N-acetylglucosaminyltransferase 3 [Eurytemora carolleeae]|uniref:beta-1,3-galactosyl-O-glycosyl-glycoprotein beta-1,6-N-acetylglucosaminyltransferase 3 n=1 Tax=Eurytemora carolleeae TaxID=1294199 RepID=UPI000C75DEEE|nr:beta-1,3-galactosyl-O-glycosyl-glycoprotein beta-1,6-N-acetylglucosaminyltransferase 3 [Eurytemora carolleeae]|eukprot:XP_023346425.1 beta-1,3-galactosyl-O-glycosyl-glycoprotein beta-1,6-N-acetylglucosaminyltransferase 3-like [Eurytemora affinis]